MGDVLDLLYGAGDMLPLHGVRAVTEEVARLDKINVKCCGRVRHAASLLPALSTPLAAFAVVLCYRISLAPSV